VNRFVRATGNNNGRRTTLFAGFSSHINIHVSATSPTTAIDTLGPQHGAPGLHNINGAELVIRLW
jgi:hypothetical protein